MEEVEILTQRAEEIGHLTDYRENFDLVVCRAVSQLATVAELTLPFCRIGGLAVIPKKAGIESELSQADGAIDLLGGKLKIVRAGDRQRPGRPCSGGPGEDVADACHLPPPPRHPRQASAALKATRLVIQRIRRNSFLLISSAPIGSDLGTHGGPPHNPCQPPVPRSDWGTVEEAQMGCPVFPLPAFAGDSSSRKRHESRSPCAL